MKAAEVTSCLVHARKQHSRKYVQTKTFACSIITARHESKFSKTRAEKRGEGKSLFGIFLGNPIRRRCSRIPPPPPPPPFSTSDKLFRTQVQAAEEEEDRITNEWHVSVCLRLSVRLFASSPPSLSVGHPYPLPYPNSSYPMFWAVKQKKSKYALLAIWSFFLLSKH